eukprot:CAMPEP_0185759656 /NCGR_PEP_ID=MMETSP1174-20130828/18417_1 /TAXON_ID=35687 /ORGANISM="Dictyocha speculum, Strain CCMP1381" /LENGTH=70 /DNA_ID=CAMNT_0028440093 /DNA_START=475 /DNA_END=687 /DNA_ORIENTATION=+
MEKTEKQETVDEADVAVVEPFEPLAKCMEEEFDATLKKCDDENVAAVDHFGAKSGPTNSYVGLFLSMASG